jgi:hypothetical protein
MTKEFTPYDRSLKLKSIGFDEPCFVFWTNTPKYKGDNIQLCITDGTHGYSPNSISFKQDFLREGEVLAPTFSQAFRWFREKYGLNSHFHHEDIDNYSYYCGIGYSDEISGYEDFKTYEEAELACLDEMIKIVELKQQEQ